MEFYLNSKNSILISENSFKDLADGVVFKGDEKSMQLFAWKLQRTIRKVYAKKHVYDLLSAKVLFLLKEIGVEIPPEELGKAHEYLKLTDEKENTCLQTLLSFYKESLKVKRASEMLYVVKQHFIENKTTKEKLYWKELLEKSKKCLKRKNVLSHEKTVEEQLIQRNLVNLMYENKVKIESLESRANVAIKILTNSLCHPEFSSPHAQLPEGVDSRPPLIKVKKLCETSSHDSPEVYTTHP